MSEALENRAKTWSATLASQAGTPRFKALRARARLSLKQSLPRTR